MASKPCSSLALFLLINLLFFSMVSACHSNCPGGSNPRPGSNPNIPNPFNPTPSPGTGTGSGGGTGTGGGTATCPRDALKLGVCANVLNGLLNVTVGQPPVTPCCTLIQGLADLEAAVCLCTAIRANILGINLNIPISLTLLLNVCSRQAPRGFQCP